MLGRSDLHDYQLDALQFLYEGKRVALWMFMGTGKTVTTLTALVDLDLVEPIFPALVLAPKTVARATWVSEVQAWSHLNRLRVSYVGGNPKQRAAALEAPADIYTMAYDNLEWLVSHLGSKWPFRTVVADEQSRLKGFRIRQGTSRAKALSKVAHTKVDRFIGLTGTPAANGLKDLWGQTWFLDKGHRLGDTYSAFEARWFRKGYDGYSLVPFDHAEVEIHEKLKDICLTVKGLPVDEPIENKLYVDLPPKAMALYRDMEKHFYIELEEHGVEAVTAAVKSNKCIAEGTEVLTDRGWVRIENVALSDKIWDGVEWVSHAGVCCNGALPVVACWGVAVTPDHLLMTTGGWRQAQEILDGKPTDRFDRPDVRLPDGTSPRRQSRYQRHKRKSAVAVALRMRQRGGAAQPKFTEQKERTQQVVRLSARRNDTGRNRQPRHDQPSFLPLMVEHEVSLLQPEGQGLEELRRSRHSCVRRMDRVFRRVLGRHGAYLPKRRDDRAGGQQRRLLQGQLPMGICAAAGEQHPAERPHKDQTRPHDRRAGVSALRGEKRYYPRTHPPGLAGEYAPHPAATARVYDILNAGPRHRFVVRGSDGLVLAHNCLQIANGAAYVDDQGSWEAIHDAKLDMLESVVEEAAGMPVLVAYSFKSDLARILKRFPKARHMDGEPRTIERWNAGGIPMLVAHPASAGHGLNLQHGGNILTFFSSGWNLEEDQQIIERIGPMRQKQAGYDRPVWIHRIMARGTLDEMVHERRETKRSVQDLLLEACQRRKEKTDA